MSTTEKSEELLPCPFCGGAALEWSRLGLAFACCDDSACPGRDVICSVEIWNRRAPSTPASIGEGVFSADPGDGYQVPVVSAAEHARVVAALKPFADLGVGSGPGYETETYRITRDAIREARDALKGSA
jgi:hypothetical protein